jgi:recombination protein RecR
MLRDLPALQALINQLRQIPYLASKHVYRVALHLLSVEQDRVDKLLKTIGKAREQIAPCQVCGNWAENTKLCSICSDVSRDQSLVCVVEQWPDLYALERVGQYRGRYHVLGGVLSPLEGIGPEQLRVAELIKRVEKESVSELIFAINPTPEGEATMSYIRTQLPSEGVTYSRLASGMPTGASLAYMDRTTIYKALAGRQPL